MSCMRRRLIEVGFTGKEKKLPLAAPRPTALRGVYVGLLILNQYYYIKIIIKLLSNKYKLNII
jgi:hypothetical protein